jgi:hypothetical protein
MATFRLFALGGGPGFLSERRNGVDQFYLQPQKVVCRLGRSRPRLALIFRVLLLYRHGVGH